MSTEWPERTTPREACAALLELHPSPSVEQLEGLIRAWHAKEVAAIIALVKSSAHIPDNKFSREGVAMAIDFMTLTRSAARMG